MRESPTRILATVAAVAENLETSLTLGAVNDGRVYHVKAIHLATDNDLADATAFQITDADDLVIWSSAALTAIATTAHSLQAHRGIAAGFTDGDGNEVVVLPDKMIVPGGYKVATLSADSANVDHGILTVFGSVFKSL